jgi:hypothetical protein
MKKFILSIVCLFALTSFSLQATITRDSTWTCDTCGTRTIAIPDTKCTISFDFCFYVDANGFHNLKIQNYRFISKECNPK